MVVYEVNLEFDVAIAEEYRAWLDIHIREILALPGFVSAQLHEVLDPRPTAGRLGLSVRYLVRDDASLDSYLREHAPRLRADGLQRFGEEGVRIRRRTLREVALDNVDQPSSVRDAQPQPGATVRDRRRQQAAE